ncbi:hypothetical protein BY996DRAFT_6414634 [Phakopsora pachyrhizi]|nr:hypothetical protein BY996DRAFT_6414634 [Phakopsora pachyrhizi]
MSSTFSTTKYLENIGKTPLELLLLTLEACLDILPEQESFIQELTKLNTSAERHSAVVYLLFHNSHRINLLGESISEVQERNTSGGDISQRDKMLGAQTFFWTKPPKEKLNEKPNEWKTKYLPMAFGEEDNEARLIVATKVRDGNPEQQIPRLIELAKFVGDIDLEKICPPTDKEVEEEIIRIENNTYSKVDNNSGGD